MPIKAPDPKLASSAGEVIEETADSLLKRTGKAALRNPGKVAVGGAALGGASALAYDQLLRDGKGTSAVAQKAYDAWSTFTQSGGQIGVDALKGKFYAMVEFVAEVINGIGGNNEGMSLVAVNWARKRQIGKADNPKFYTPDGLVALKDLPPSHPSHVPLDIKPDQAVDASIDEATYTTAFKDAMADPRTTRDFSNPAHLSAAAINADPELGDEIAYILNNERLRSQFNSWATLTEAQAVEKIVGLHEGLRQTNDIALTMDGLK